MTLRHTGKEGHELQTRIKICGLKTIEDIHMVNRLRPDYVGFVFAGRKRRITYEQAEEMKRELVPEIASVGVFVNEEPERVADAARCGILDYIQLHGDEDAGYIRHLKELTGQPLIKAVRVRNSEDILRAQELGTEYLLLDACREGEYGGAGETFPWEMIPGELTKPYFLAGGLDRFNVRAALKILKPLAVDVSSSVETDGRKDEEKVRQFMEAVHYSSLYESENSYVC